jgi:hypothetical protein
MMTALIPRKLAGDDELDQLMVQDTSSNMKRGKILTTVSASGLVLALPKICLQEQFRSSPLRSG